MYNLLRPSLSLSLCMILLSPAASISEDAKPRKRKRIPIVSPLLGTHGEVTFQIKADKAERVVVQGQMPPGYIELVKGDQGLWSATIEGVMPGVYEYSFLVDGLRMLDPGNRYLKPMRSPKTSILYIPGTTPIDFNPDIEHGTIHFHEYHSKPIGRFRELNVYTPPGYENSTGDYPLLVLQHGHSDSYATWTAHGKAHWILDNLIASGNAKPMIVLMLDGHPIPSSYGNGRSPENTESLRKDLLQAALPMIEQKYRIKKGPEHRAIAGLSMGGMHAISIGLNELDHFGWIGAFSAAIPEQDSVNAVFSDVSRMNHAIRLLWIACGKKDSLVSENRRFIQRLETEGIEHTWQLTDGGHNWPVWREYLVSFLPELFKFK